jgi:hypothetical protein
VTDPSADGASDDAVAQIDAVERIIAVGVAPDVDAVRAIGRILLRLSLDPRADDTIKQQLGEIAADAEALFAKTPAPTRDVAQYLRDRARLDCGRLRAAFRIAPTR